MPKEFLHHIAAGLIQVQLKKAGEKNFYEKSCFYSVGKFL